MRRSLPANASWDEMRAGFRWRVARGFNIAAAICDSWASQDPERVALVHIRRRGGVEHWTFARLREAADRFAGAMTSAGVRRGDRIAHALGQGPEALIAHFALLKIGAISVPVAMLLPPEAVVYRLADCGARGIICDAELLDAVMAMRPDTELRLFWTSGAARAPARSFWDDIAAAQPLRSYASTGPDDPAFLLYTSGTEGPPKGVLHAHRVLLGHLPALELHHPSFPQSGDLGWTPSDWTWLGTLMAVLPFLWYGVPLLSRKLARFDPEEVWRLVVTHGVRNIACTPSALRVLRTVPAPARHRLRSIGTGGERLDLDMREWWRDALGVDLSEGYGLTECSIAVATCPGRMEMRPGWLGLAVPGFDVAVVDAAGAPVEDGQTGEIAIAGPNPSMFLRYWNDPDRTAGAFRGRWFCTGDLGVRDAAGYFRYIARGDDLIISSGYRLGPGEIEAALNSHPAVRGSAVVGLPDPVRTQVVAAFVWPNPGAQTDGLEDELIERVRNRVGPHAAPRRLRFVNALPLTSTGKIERRAMRDGWDGSA